MPDNSHRPVNPDYSLGGYQIAFSDSFPLLLISEASMKDLNRRLPVKFSMNRFHPNLVANNTGPYEEGTRELIEI